ncbi:MAG TPA: DUF6504 family protein [Gammaproteobacteria bacterium]|nr:DUF6504 family protein [Gammaproteobacteria bacterium]
MTERFVSEAIKPVSTTFDAGRMAVGEPGLPAVFRWRGQDVTVSAVRRTWRETGPCRNGSGERYVRKHWYEIETTDHRTMRLYFDRQPRGRTRGTPRWWLFTVNE